jgi:predicted O-methyltransferase YrrM
VFAQWKLNIEHFAQGNVSPWRMGWRKYLSFIDVPIALAFIDAEHTYIEVKENVEAFLPLMSPGGIICGDDAHHPPVRQALDELFGLDNLECGATVWVWRVPA